MQSMIQGRVVDPNAHWIVKGDVGIRCFPRVGSQSLLRTYSYNQNLEKWLNCKQKFIVVRNPWERLLSAWAMFWPPQDFGMEARGYPPCKSLDDLLIYLSSSLQSDLDLHTRSMVSQLVGIELKGSTVVSLAYMSANPPMEVSQKDVGVHLHKTMIPPPVKFSAENFRRWRLAYDSDWRLWELAKKVPHER